MDGRCIPDDCKLTTDISINQSLNIYHIISFEIISFVWTRVCLSFSLCLTSRLSRCRQNHSHLLLTPTQMSAAAASAVESDSAISGLATLVTNQQNCAWTYLNATIKLIESADITRAFAGTGTEDLRSELQKWLPSVKPHYDKFMTAYGKSSHPMAVKYRNEFEPVMKKTVELMPLVLEVDDLRAMINTVDKKFGDVASLATYWSTTENGGAKLAAALKAFTPKWNYLIEYCEKYGIRHGMGMSGAAAPPPDQKSIQPDASGKGIDHSYSVQRQSELVKVMQKYEPVFEKAKQAQSGAGEKDKIESELKSFHNELNASSVSQLVYAAKNRIGSVNPEQFKKLWDTFLPRYEAFDKIYRAKISADPQLEHAKRFMEQYDPVVKLGLELLPAIMENMNRKADIAKLVSGAALGGAVSRGDVSPEQFNRLYKEIKDCYEPFRAKYAKYASSDDEIKTIFGNYDVRWCKRRSDRSQFVV